METKNCPPHRVAGGQSGWKKREKQGSAQGFHQFVAVSGAGKFRGTGNHFRKVERNRFFGNHPVNGLNQQIGGFRPAHVAQHHLRRQDDGAGVGLVQSGQFRPGAVRSFKNGMPRQVVDVASGGDSDAADLRRQGVGDVIPVQIQRGYHVEVFRMEQNFLKEGVCNAVLDNDTVGKFQPRVFPSSP